MKVTILDDLVPVHADMDSASPMMGQLLKGEEVELGNVADRNGVQWVAVTLLSGTRGFILGTTKISQAAQFLLLEDVNLYQAPDAKAHVHTRLAKNTKISLGEVVHQNGEAWVKVSDQIGNEGFIAGTTRIWDLSKGSSSILGPPTPLKLVAICAIILLIITGLATAMGWFAGAPERGVIAIPFKYS